jgi:peptidoglycan/LPS O-acetylase OafA/YrhL
MSLRRLPPLLLLLLLLLGLGLLLLPEALLLTLQPAHAEDRSCQPYGAACFTVAGLANMRGDRLRLA